MDDQFGNKGFARKRPVIIEYRRWTGDSEQFIMLSEGFLRDCEHCLKRDLTIVLKTLEGDMAVSVGDYIIKGVVGEFYPCKPDIFNTTYQFERD